MKSRNEKPKKKLETNIGKIIYGFLLFMPLLAIGVTCITTFWNTTITMPNQQVIDIPPYQTNEVNTINDLVVGNIYDFKIMSHYNGSDITYFNATTIYNIINDTKKIDIDISNTNDTQLTFSEASNYYVIKSNNRQFFITDYAGKTELENITIQFVYKGNFKVDYISQVSKATWIPAGSYEIIENESTDLNVFYYSIDKVEQSNLFNWSKNSLIYTGMSNTAQALDISNTFIPMLLTYWLIISVFYYLYDIILIILHVFHRKIHELEENI